MKRKIKLFFIGTLSIMLIVPTLWYGLQFYWQNKTKKLYSQAINNYQKKYAYTLVEGTLDQTLYATNKDNGKKLLDYYNKTYKYYKGVASGEIERTKELRIIDGDSLYADPYAIPVPIKYLGVPQEVYVPKDLENDSVAKVYVFNTSCWGYLKAYIPVMNLHDELPPDSLSQKFYKFLESIPSQSDGIYGSLSPYGFYCN